MRWRWWRTADEMAADFARHRVPMSDEEFVSVCGLPDEPEAYRVALAVRRSVARYGMVDHGVIRASDRYPDELIELSGWDSIDFLGWVFELERELGEKVKRVAFRRLGHPFSVRDLVWAVYRYRQEQRCAEHGEKRDGTRK